MTVDPQPCELSELLSEKAQARRARKAARAGRKGPPAYSQNQNAIAGVGKTRLQPRNQKQSDLLCALGSFPIVVAIGPAGTGKTYVTARWAMQRLLTPSSGKTRIVITRPTEAPRRHRQGFLPGGSDKKLAPWLIPIMDGFKAETSAANIAKLMLNGSIEIVPFEHMRGRSFDESIILLDEAQNCTFSDIELFTTRIGEDSTMILSGDPYQDDLRDQGLESGLVPFWRMVPTYQLDVGRVAFSVDDVVRSGPAAALVKAFHLAKGHSLGVEGYNF